MAKRVKSSARRTRAESKQASANIGESSYQTALSTKENIQRRLEQLPPLESFQE